MFLLKINLIFLPKLLVMNKLKFIISLICALLLLLGSILTKWSTNLLSFIFSIGIPFLVLVNLGFLIYWSFKKKTFLMYSLISLIIHFFCYDSFFQVNFSKDDLSKNSFSLLSFNVRHFDFDKEINSDNIDTGIMTFIKEQNPDIVSFQEFSRPKLKDFKEYPYRFVGYRKEVKKSLQVIYSKFPIVNSGYLDFPNTLNNAIYADVLINDEKVRIYNNHLQSFAIRINSNLMKINRYVDLFNKIATKLKLKEKQVLMVLDHAESFDGKVIICGDFNSTQFSSAYNALKKNRKDTFIEAGQGIGNTYELFKYPLRLDYVLTDNTFNVLSHKNFNLKLSDHEPILVELELN